MSGIIWLASYPKSGNTWLRVLLTNYLRVDDEPAHINQLDGGPIASARLWFDEWVGVEASSLEEATIDRLRPEVYRRIAADSADPLFMKVHDAWTLTDTGEPMFPADATKGVVYIVRNPLDVAPSLAHHIGGTIEEAVARLLDTSPPIRKSGHGLPDQLHQRRGSWSQHVRSWVDESGLAVHVVRYEDLWADTAAALAGVVRFAHLNFDGDRIHKAVAFSSFSELQRQEAGSPFHERLAAASALFFRRGQVGSWREDLPDGLARRLADVCLGTMNRFGYASPFE